MSPETLSPAETMGRNLRFFHRILYQDCTIEGRAPFCGGECTPPQLFVKYLGNAYATFTSSPFFANYSLHERPNILSNVHFSQSLRVSEGYCNQLIVKERKKRFAAETTSPPAPSSKTSTSAPAAGPARRPSAAGRFPRLSSFRPSALSPIMKYC